MNHDELARELTRAAKVALACVVLGVLGLALSRLPGAGAATAWLPNALVFGVLVRRPPRYVPLYLAACFAGRFATGLLVGDAAGLTLALSTSAALGVGVSYAAARAGVDVTGTAPSARWLGWLVFSAVAGQVVAGAVASLALVEAIGVDYLSTWFAWVVGNFYGALVLLPTLLAWSPKAWRRLRQRRGLDLLWLTPLVLALSIGAEEWLSQPFLVISLPLLLAAWRLGLLGTAILTGLDLLVLVTKRVLELQFTGSTDDATGDLLASSFNLYTSLAIVAPLLLSIAQEKARHAKRQLVRSDENQRRLLNDAPSGLVMVSPDGTVLMANVRAAALFGYPQEQMLGLEVEALLPGGLGGAPTGLQPQPSLSIACERQARRSDGTEVAVEVWVNASRSRYGNATLLSVNDISARRQLQDELARAHEMAEVTLRSISDGVITVDAEQRVRFINPAAERATGLARKDAIGHPVTQVLHIVDGDTGRPVPIPFAVAMRENRTVTLGGHRRLLGPSGVPVSVEESISPIHDAGGRPVGAVMAFRDVSRVHEMALEMKRQAQHDPLTGLPNRLLLQDRIGQAMATAQREGHRLAVIFIDLDGFKGINDSLGHDVGDALLQAVSTRLQSALRDSDTVCRLGGDEFVVLLQRVQGPDDAIAAARKLLRVGREPYVIGGSEIRLSFSLGVALYPDDGLGVADLLRNADAAMYRSKHNGRNRFSLAEESAHVAGVLGSPEISGD